MNDVYDDDEYTVESGTIVDVRPGEVVVRIEKSDADCGGCRSCAMKSLCRGREAGHLDLPVPVPAGGDAPAVEGQRVRIAYRPTNAAVAGLIMFVPSLVGLLLGGLGGYRLGGGSDAILLVGCFAGIAAGIGVSFAISRLSPSLKPSVRLLPE
jgi:Positive regulator of sigma E activity